jgi:hypothetical protein
MSLYSGYIGGLLYHTMKTPPPDADLYATIRSRLAGGTAAGGEFTTFAESAKAKGRE